MELTQKPRAIEGLEIRMVGGEWLVHDPANSKVHVLNESAAKILKLCDGDRTYDDIAKSLSEGTSADAKQVADDVARMISQFAELGLVR